MGLGKLVRRILLAHLKVAGHAAVHDIQINSVLQRQHAYGRAASEEVFHHLPGHIDRIGRHTLSSQSMIRSEHHHLRCIQIGSLATHDAGNAQGQLFQHAQRSLGLGLEIQAMLDAGLQRRVMDVLHLRTGPDGGR